MTSTTASFEDLGLAEALVKGAEKQGYEAPTPMQSMLVPPALEGADLLVQSRQGTGKTAALGLPLLHRLSEGRPFSGLVLVPRGENAVRLAEELRGLGRFAPIRACAVQSKQRTRFVAEKLRRKPAVVLGPPDRLLDLHRKDLVPLDGVELVILDELDRLLELGFRDDVRTILRTLPRQRQTIIVTATVNEEIEQISHAHQTDPRRLTVVADEPGEAEHPTQRYFDVEPWDKTPLLLHLLQQDVHPQRTLVFCRSDKTVDSLAEYLGRKGVETAKVGRDVEEEPGGDGEAHVLLTSDANARGLEIDGIDRVINYDLPGEPEEYLHRIGRLERSDRRGVAWSFVGPDQTALLKAVIRLAAGRVDRAEAEGFEPGPPPDLARGAVEPKGGKAGKTAEAEPPHAGYSRAPVVPPTDEAEMDPSRFPGGLVPVALPPKRMGGRVPTRRS